MVYFLKKNYCFYCIYGQPGEGRDGKEGGVAGVAIACNGGLAAARKVGRWPRRRGKGGEEMVRGGARRAKGQEERGSLA